MLNSKIVFLINKGVRAVTCRYDNEEDAPRETPKVFKTFDQNIKAGDFVVVPTQTRHMMTVMKVVETDVEIDLDGGPEVDWIIDTVSLEQFHGWQEGERQAIKKVRERERERRQAQLLKDTFGDDHDEIIEGLAIAGPAPGSAEVIDGE